MMEYDDFYLIAEYGNENWKGSFTPREIANNAYDYLCEFQASKIKGNQHMQPTHAIKELTKLLAEDGSGDCRWWLRKIAEELGLINIDWQDYLETDDWLKEFI